ASTPWWRDRLRDTCVGLQDEANVAGVYLDTMQGCSLPCYWTPHGHSAGGGSSSTVGMYQLVKYIREAMRAKDPEAIITGENSTEGMIDQIDGILQHTLTPQTTVPIFATVYRDYICRYGLELSLSGDDFYIECASMFTEGMQIGRIRLKP